jgi:RND family efflux transporter MFP subunit
MERMDSPHTTGTDVETHGEGEVFDPAPFRPTTKRLGWSVIGVAALFGCLVTTGVVPRVLRRSAMAAEARSLAETPVHVAVVRAERSTAASSLALPGSVQPLQETGVYARANGYVRKWLFDIGAPVKKGEIMAELEVPDIDEELRQAEAAEHQAHAQIRQAETQRELAKITNERYTALGPSGVVTQQEVDQYRAGYDAQQANVLAAEAARGSALANVQRLRDLKGFGVIVAPFDGVVTARTAEIGQLVTAGTGSGQPLFKVAEVDTVRVFVNVPQLYAGSIRVDSTLPPASARSRGARSPAEWPGRRTSSTSARGLCSPRSTFRTRTIPSWRACTPRSRFI